MGAYSRWALIRGWALIRINTVINTTCVRGRTQFFKIVGFAGKRFLRSLPPPLSFPVFLLSSQLSRRTRAEKLAMQAIFSGFRGFISLTPFALIFSLAGRHPSHRILCQLTNHCKF